ncbi:MAG: hypothetical protein AB1466_00535 [Actinomycetota bacterium]
MRLAIAQYRVVEELTQNLTKAIVDIEPRDFVRYKRLRKHGVMPELLKQKFEHERAML